jgi:hypothetical protein
MRIPRCIKLGGVTIRVDRLSNMSNAMSSGCYHGWADIITICMDHRSESGVAGTFMHEIVEAINADCNLDLNHNQITQIANGVFAAIRQNNLDFRHLRKKGR